jgi:hypothetical protein
MAKYEDYVKARDPEAIAAKEIEEAAAQQATREETPPETDWQKRYKDLEVAYSRQGQQIGDYRKLIDEYVTATPENSQIDSVSENPITPDDLYENPDEAVRRAVDSHPAIQEVRSLKQDLEDERTTALRAAFNERHPTAEAVASTPEFANWVNEDATRLELAQRGHQFDMISADALFDLWEAEQAAQAVTVEDATAAVDAVGLETGTTVEPLAPERYSRGEMLEQKIAAAQGNESARRYVKQHAVAYREALAAGNVRD